MSLSQAFLAIAMSASEGITNPAGGIDTHGDAINVQQNLSNGTGAGNAQKVGGLTAATSTGGTNYDLTAFAGGINAAAINFSKVKWAAFQNLDATNSITLTFTGSNGWTNGINGVYTLHPGEVLIIKDDTTGKVVDSTHKVIAVAAVAGTPSIHMTLIGEGA